MPTWPSGSTCWRIRRSAPEGEGRHGVRDPAAAERDRFSGADLFRETAERIPDGRLILSRRRGHMVMLGPFFTDVLSFLQG